MRKTFKEQLIVFIPECIFFAFSILFGILVLINLPLALSYITHRVEAGMMGKSIDLIVFTVSFALILICSAFNVTLGHLSRHRDLYPAPDKAAFVSGIIFFIFDAIVLIVFIVLIFQVGIA